MGKTKDLGHLAHIVAYDTENHITVPAGITMHTNQLVASQAWVTTALGSYALSSSLGSYVPTSRTITINGTTYDLSANRNWDITSMIYPAAGIALSTGSAWGTSITNNSGNWNTAYGWGNHASAGYLTGITSTQVTTALGFTPVTNARTITINGTAYDLTANREWTVSGTDSTKLPLAGGTLTGILSFSNVTGNKIDFYYSGEDRYGIQVQSSELRIHCGAQGASDGGITFGKSTSTTFTEYLRVRNDGVVLTRNDGTGASWRGRIGHFNATADKSVWFATYNGFAVVGAHNNALTAWADLLVNCVNNNGDGGTTRLSASSFVGSNAIIHAGNIGSQSVSYATSSGSSGSVSGLTLTNSGSGINPDSVTQNQIGYNTSVSLFGQSDGGLYSSAYNSSWIHQIYGDFRTGQIAIRGKNSGSWTGWRTVLDSSNVTSYMDAPNRAGTSYYQVATWLQLTGVHGLYCPSVNGAHFYPNDASYGAWRVSGTRNGWNGMHFGGANGITLMMNETEFGFHREGVGWVARFTSGHFHGYANSAGSISGQANSATINATSGNAGNNIVLRDGNGDIAIGTLNTNHAYFGGGGRGLTSADTYGSYGNVMTYGTGQNGWYGYGIYDQAGYRSFFMSNNGNFGLYGQTIGKWAFYYGNSTASYAIGSDSPVAGYTLYLIYGLYTVGLYNASDARMKKDIKSLSNSLDKVKQLRGVSYEYIDKGEDGTKNKGLELGFIAQEVLPIIPELIRYDEKKGYAMNYNGVSAVLVEAVKEQQVQIEAQQTQIENQQNQINTLISQLTELLNK